MHMKNKPYLYIQPDSNNTSWSFSDKIRFAFSYDGLLSLFPTFSVGFICYLLVLYNPILFLSIFYFIYSYRLFLLLIIGIPYYLLFSMSFLFWTEPLSESLWDMPH